MAARRVLSFLAAKSPSNPLSGDISWIPLSANCFSRIIKHYPRRYQSPAESTDQKQLEIGSSGSESETHKSTSTSGNIGTTLKHQVNSKLKVSERHDLVMMFTCKVCDTRSMKTACRESYDKGVVVARCDGCNNLHLIADRLGWFGEPGSVEEFLAARGEKVKKGSADTLNITLEDLSGKAE